jgi:hypothetical protein
VRKTFGGVIIALGAAAGGALLAAWSAPVAGQTAAAYRAPRTADGKPDLNGIWQSLSGRQLRHRSAHGASREWPCGQAPTARCLRRRCSRSAPVGAVPPGIGHRRRRADSVQAERSPRRKRTRRSGSERDPEIKCYLPGVPRATYMPYPFRFCKARARSSSPTSTPGAVRNIYLKDPGPPPVDRVDGPVGRPLGRRDVRHRVNGFNDSTWFDRCGNFHSEAMKVTERITRTGPDVLSYEATIDDPNYLHAPLEDQPAALPPAREERAAHGLQVRRVRRRAALRPMAQEAADQVMWIWTMDSG